MNKKDSEYRKRTAWRKKNLKLVYFGKDDKKRLKAENDFWINASPEAKFLAMKEFVRDQLIKLGLAEHGPKLLRFTAVIRRK